MEKTIEEMLPLLEVDNGCMVSKMGDYTVGFEVVKPEVFTLSEEDYEAFHLSWVKAIRVLPEQTIFHMQDWWVQSAYQADFDKENRSFLSGASERFFHERPYRAHRAYIFLTKKPAGRKSAHSALSSLLRGSLVPEETLDRHSIQEFLEFTGQFARILTDSGFMQFRRLDTEDLVSTQQKAGIIEQYCYLSGPAAYPEIRDIVFENSGIRIGDRFCQCYTLADAEKMPAHCSSRINYDRYSTDRTKFSVGFAAALGQLLPCNHIYNQYLFLDDAKATLKKMESKRLRLQALANYSRENAIAESAVNSFLDEAISQQRLPLKVHFNVLAWTDNPAAVKELKNTVASAIAQTGAIPHLETVGAPQIWWAGIPGNAADFPMNETADLFAEQAACFLSLETNYRSSLSPFGIRLGDRQTGMPVHVDLSDEPKKRGVIANFNKFIISGSGGGKSFFCNHMVRAYYEQGTHIVIIDVGHSYEIQCALHKGYYFEYEENNPIRFNPFYVSEGDTLDTEKRESIKALLLALWKREDESFNRSEYVALSNALQGYLERLEKDPSLVACFNSFYEFLRDEFVHILEKDRVKEKDFDINNFLFVLRPYYKGGEYDYLLNASENLDLLQQRFIVFELDNIKNHEILFPVVTLIIISLFMSKMRKLKGIRKMLLIEEAWKAIARKGMAESMQYWVKTLRKFYSEFVVVTQEIEDIISSPIVKQAIINNSDCKILLDQSKYQNKFDQIQELLGISDKQKAEVLSINKGHEPGSLYKDLWICLGSSFSKVYRLETSLEEYLTYTSDQKEKLRVWASIKKYGDVQKGIAALAAEMRAG